jgi:hypothetical protein
MEARPRSSTLGRDDIDRLLIVGGIAWLWLTEPFFAIPLAPIAAVALWLNVVHAKPILFIAAAVTALVAAWIGQGAPAWGVLVVAAALAVAVGALRVRIPAGGPQDDPEPEAGDRLGPADDDRAGREDETGPAAIDDDPPASWDDPAEDPVLLRFMDRAAHLDLEETRALGGAWQAVAQADRSRAWARVRTLLRTTGRERLVGGVAEEIERWGRAQGGSPWTWEFGTMTDVDRGDIRRAAMPPLLDAAAAIVLRDALDPADREVLAGPWEAIVSGTSTLR